MKNAKLFTIKDIAIGIYDGPHATPPDSTEGPIFLSIDNVTDEGRLDLSEVKLISERDFPKWTRRVTPKEDDIVFSYEATLHRYAMLPKGFHGCLGRRMVLVRTNQERVLPRFLHYYFLSRKWRSVIEANIINGATVDRIPIKKFPFFKVYLPTLISQKNIASFVDLYDQLIDTNRRRIQLLEESARLLFREWFVYFKFPGHEKVKIIKEGISKTPEGWVKEKVVSVVKRVAPGELYDQATAEPTGIVPILDQGQSGIIGYHNNEPSMIASLDNPVIVFANHTCNQRIIHFPFSAIQNIFPFLPSDINYRNIYWLHYATDNLVQLNAYKGHWPEFMAKSILLPPEGLCEKFGNIISIIHKQIFNITIQNQRLTQARDLLLPRLMSGKIEV